MQISRVDFDSLEVMNREARSNNAATQNLQLEPCNLLWKEQFKLCLPSFILQCGIASEVDKEFLQDLLVPLPSLEKPQELEPLSGLLVE